MCSLSWTSGQAASKPSDANDAQPAPVLKGLDPTTDWIAYAKQLDAFAKGDGQDAAGDLLESIESEELQKDERLARKLCEADIEKVKLVVTPEQLGDASIAVAEDVLGSLTPEAFPDERVERNIIMRNV